MIKKNNKNIIFFIGARGGSKGLLNKNLKKINNKSLISITIDQIKKSKFYTEIIVSSNSPKIIEEARKNKVDFIIKRPKNLSSSTAPKFDVWKHAIKLYEKSSGNNIDLLVDLDCTNPLRYTKDIDNIIKIKLRSDKSDAVVSIANSRKNPYFNMVEYNNYQYLEISKKEKNWPSRRQDAPKVYDQVASIYCMNANFVKKNNFLYQGNIKGYLLRDFQAFDVDNQLDFDLVKYIYKKYNFD